MRAMLISQSLIGKRIVPLRETGAPNGESRAGKPVSNGMKNDEDLGKSFPGLRHFSFRSERKA